MSYIWGNLCTCIDIDYGSEEIIQTKCYKIINILNIRIEIYTHSHIHILKTTIFY